MKSCYKNEKQRSTLITVEFLQKNPVYVSLSDCAKFFSKVAQVQSSISDKLFFVNDVIVDKNLYKIINEFADAIDENSVERVKVLKERYAGSKDFKVVLEFLNEKCKLVWGGCCTSCVPKQAMQVLGLTNEPSLESLLSDALILCESNDASFATSKIIDRIIKDDKLSYSMEDIHNYLKKFIITKNLALNAETVKYLINVQHYAPEKLLDLGLKIEKFYKFLPFKEKIKLSLRKFLSR